MADRGGEASWASLNRWQKALVVLVVAGFLAAMGGIAYAIQTGTTPHFRNPNFVEAILESRLVMALVRIAVVAFCVYVVISIVGHISHGRWLSGVGPVKVGESVRAVNQEAGNLQGQLEAAEKTIRDLSGRLKTTEDALGVANRDRDEVIREFTRFKKEKKGPGQGG